MTTLPQTTNVRLPRPMGGGIQLAGAGGALAAAGGGQQTQQGASEVWRVIRSHIWMILIVSLIVAPLAGYGAHIFLRAKYPKYTAVGVIQVQPQIKYSEILKDQSNAEPATVALEIRTHAKRIENDSWLTKVLQNPNSEVRKTKWFGQFGGDLRKAKLDFQDNLSVTPLQDTKLVKVEFTYSEPADTKTIVQDLVQTYLTSRSDRRSTRCSTVRRCSTR